MINVTDVWLDRIVYFKKAHIPITDNNGFVIITGHNKDSKVAADQNNGSGKSLLCSSIPNLRYSAAPLSVTKNAKKEMLSTPQSSISMVFETNEDETFRVTQTQKKWVIEKKDGDTFVDTEARTIAIQQAKLDELFPISELEFYSYVYVQSQKRLSFQDAKPPERLSFITEMFNLNEYDILKKSFTKKLGIIKDEQTKFGVLESKLLTINTSLNKLKWSEKKQLNLEEAKQRLSYVKHVYAEVSSELNKTKTLLHGLDNLKSLEEDLLKISSSVQIDYIGTAEEVSSLSERMHRHIDLTYKFDNYNSQLATFKKQSRTLNSKLDSLSAANLPSIKILKEELEKLESKLDEATERKSEIKRIERNLREAEKEQDRLLGLIKKLGFDKFSDIDTESQIDDDISICRTTLKLKSLLDSGEGECPTCLQHVDIDNIKANVKKAKRKLEKLTLIREGRKILHWHTKNSKVIDTLTNRVDAEDAPKTDKIIDSLKKKINDVRSKLQTRKQIKDIQSDISKLEKPVRPPEVPTEDFTLKQAKSIIDSCSNILKIYHSRDNVYKHNSSLRTIVDKYSLDKAVSKYRKKYKKLKLEHAELSEENSELIKYCSRMDLKQGEYNVLSKQKLELESELEELKPLLEKRDMFKALEQAYGSKGLKVEKADEIVGILETNLNQYSHLIFAEAFTFHVYANEGGISCDVDRGNGRVSDVRLLSGAESDCFRLLFMMSLLVMAPSQRRLNFAILDEPDSHMDIPTKELFRDQYLPYLRQIVPHVILIIPLDHHFYNDYEHWTVVKHKGVSKLVRE